MIKKDCLDKHVYIRKDDWNYIKELINSDATQNSFTDVLHELVAQSKSQKNTENILTALTVLQRQVGSMSKDILMNNHMLGELFFINDLEYVRHGVTPTIQKSAMKLVDRDIKNKQERKYS